MVILTGHTLTLDEVKRVLYDNEKVIAAKESMDEAARSRQAVDEIVANKRIVYGITTGFGKFSDVFIEADDVEELQWNLIHSHACGVGEPFPEIVSRAMLLLRANALLKGYSGVRPVVIQRLLDLLNAHIHPVVPQQGSLGASGDLAPLSHLALALLGEGEVFYRGQRVLAMEALTKEGIAPFSLKAKEGLALINGTQAMTAMGVVGYLEAEQLAYESELIAAVTLEGLRGIIDAFDERVHLVRGYRQQTEVAKRIRSYLAGSKLTTAQGELRVQDAYSLRCIPQVHGASWQALDYVKEKLEIEMNAATDNPLIFDDGATVISGGNFHGQPIALAMDFMKIAVAELANISERRIERLVNPQLNDLPPFLSPAPGLQSGAMIMQYAAASLVSENKTLAHPASVDSIPSSANQEDHVSMGTIASRHAHAIIQNARRVLAIELICALQAVEYRGVEHMAPKTRAFYEAARKIVPSITKDRIFAKDIEAAAKWLKDVEWDFFSQTMETVINR
ncbi:histidine ammonia-lyase [Anoxybacillus sp. LAT_35]|uniref:histidine ammonia-lyase n=2 Tax=Anoxybacillus TaxID=150247 RepID=UPI001EDBB507|nr:histidine ammonia-lyase [Anoxybacillus sp. LAT_26]MCG3083599.1 histidine ammonia-lyase [Anoxybacillus sp. LAT27]MCG5025064.1 histidine ammonia-lyase [Anoxybacillus flavithermus]MCG6170298.1 histidine ammonia-lyase [Anoxybacillus sp. LAT_11]MCG6174829.1 histidine ammonia-lyase [Anoxybacillus sp. LAT_31]MCG6178527.1 histidine ammonia-lyase [Anoxybacillus sp. LAT_35]MCG6195972.1 histidine ammonia-lyase [Anoxybacillus sp. LAT_38]